MKLPHADTRALITGGAQGLGLSVARALAEEGCTQMVIADRNLEQARAAATDLHAQACHVEMGDMNSVRAMVDAANARMGGITALVNCAATTARGSILDTTPARWDEIMDVNAKGAFFALQRFAQLAIEAGHAASAVNILSIVVHGGLPFLAPYAASKAALLNITKNSANTLAKHRIRVNGINVGWMDTPGEDMRQQVSHDRTDGWLAEVEANMPFGQLVKPEHVAAQTAFLLGPRSGVVTGSIIDFDQQVVGVYPDTNDS